MLVAFPSHQGDIVLLTRLLRWIQKLDGTLKNHDALLAFDAATPTDKATEAIGIAEQIFRETRVFVTDKHYSGWPVACNHMFHAVSKWAFEHGTKDFLLMEPDAVPLSKGWLDRIEWDYRASGKRWMGHIEDCAMPLMPSRVMSGVAVYCGDTAARIQDTSVSGRPWNTDASAVTVPDGEHTLLIKDFFGQVGLSPIFVESKTPTSPSHHFTLDWLPEEAVLFHRDKTHSLMPLLAKKLGIEWQQESKRQCEKIVVVFPVHGGDLHLALHHTIWLRKMNTRWPHRAIIAFDPTTPTAPLNQLHSLLEPCFAGGVEFFHYPHFPGAYPHVANFAFQSVAHHMAKGTAPWFWCEPDLVVLRPDWLEQLQAEYERAQKSWMGPVVHQMGHMNGTSVYPPDAAHRMPRAMACGAGQAFDMEMKEDTIHDRHDCGHLLYHVWSILNDAPCPVGGGQVPGPITAEQARRWLPKEAVATHRWKTRHLIDLLLTGQYRHE